MSVFERYAGYYDLLYDDKLYDAEVLFVSSLIRAALPAASQILELGCGTGKHAMGLASIGFEVLGVDLSVEMVERAKLLSRAASSGRQKTEFHVGDVRTFRGDSKFDAVLSLFHVMSYQTTISDLTAAIDTAAYNLRKGGLFVFDFWYGPAVLSIGPSVRIKRVENDAIAVVRIAEPVVNSVANTVDVNYSVFVTDKVSGQVESFGETHAMRYLFMAEVRDILEVRGFEIQKTCEWLTGAELGRSTWSATVVASLVNSIA